jgi:serine/threonine-protein kinase HipA
MAVPPSQKYQSDGGPAITDCIDLLRGSDRPTEDQSAFFKAQILFWLLGATDGHAKNFSLFLRPGSGFAMTPLYDILSAQKALDEGQVRHGQMKLAMSVGNKNRYRLDQVTPRHFLQSAKAAGFGVTLAEQLLAEIHVQVPSAIEATLEQLSADFPAELSDAIVAGITARHRLLGLGLAAIAS